MPEYAITPDVEGLAITALTNGLAQVTDVAGLHVGTKIPTDSYGQTLDEFVRIFASNVQTTTIITHSFTLTVEGWAQSEIRAQRINSVATAVLREQAGRLFDFTELGGGNTPHPDFPNLSRYQSLMSGRVRDQILTI